jgi:hypothetical protein
MTVRLETRNAIARGLVGIWITGRYVQEMRENYRKGDWLEAAKDTGWFAVAITPVVAPRFFFGTIAFPVTVGVAAGVATTAVVLEVTGLGDWEDAVVLALDPPTPVEWVEVVVPAIQSEVTEPIIEYVTEELWQKQLVDPITAWGSRRKKELIQGKEDIEQGFRDMYRMISF